LFLKGQVSHSRVPSVFAKHKQQHQVRLIAAQFLKPFVKSNKNDFAAAEAIAEAVQKASMRFVPIKTQDQLNLQALHRVRDRLMQRRTNLINQLRALLLERGITVLAGVAQLNRRIPELLQTVEQVFSSRMATVVPTTSGRVAIHRGPNWIN
jgi:transposase